MAKFTVNFNANTTGEHRVYYRKYSDDPTLNPVTPTYTDYVSVSVSVPGPQSVDVEPPIPPALIAQIEGNTYCGDIEYTGYVIAEYQFGDPDTNGSGIPDSVEASGAVFTATFNQVDDPCILYDIECNNVPIDTLSLATGGSGYAGTETVVIDAPTAPGGVQATATPSFGTGSVTGISISGGGTGYIGSGPYTVTPVLTTGGYPPTTGTGLTIDIVITAGIVTSAVINTPGNADFVVADSQLTINPADVGGIGFGTDCLLIISAAAGWKDELVSVTLTDPGSGYEVIPTVAMSPESGDPATYNITMGSCPALNISTYACGVTGDGSAGSNSLDDQHVLKLGDSISFGVNTSTLPLPSEFTAVERATPDIAPCHCRGCAQYQITNGTGSTKKITFQSCWDGFDDPSLLALRTVSYDMVNGEVLTTECAMKDTLVLEDPNGSWNIQVLNSPCV